MPSGLPRPVQEFKELELSGDLSDIDYTGDSNALWRARKALILTAALSLVLFFFIGLSLIFSAAIVAVDPRITGWFWWSIVQLVLAILVLVTVPFWRHLWLAIVLAALAVIDLLLESVQFGARIANAASCGVSCSLFEYLYVFYGFFLFLLAIGFVTSSIAFVQLMRARDHQSATIRGYITKRANPSDGGRATPGNAAPMLFDGAQASTLRQRFVNESRGGIVF